MIALENMTPSAIFFITYLSVSFISAIIFLLIFPIVGYFKERMGKNMMIGGGVFFILMMIISYLESGPFNYVDSGAEGMIPGSISLLGVIVFVIGFLIKIFTKQYEIPVEGINRGSVIDTSPSKKIISILHWLGIILLIAAPFIDLIVLLAIPLFLITIPVLLLKANKIAEAGDVAGARRYQWFAVSPFIIIALGLIVFVTSNYI